MTAIGDDLGSGGQDGAQPQAGTSLLRGLLGSRCPKCGTKGFRAGVYSCQSCGWKDPILEPWVPSGWYQDPANPNQARQWNALWRNWVGKPRTDVTAKPVPTTPPPGWLAPASVTSAPADPSATFRKARVVSLIAAIIAGALTATHWYSVSEGQSENGEPIKLAHGLWTEHPAIAALIVVGAALVVATCAASLFRVPSDRPNLPSVVLGFAALAALVAAVSSVVGLADTPPAASFGLPSDVFHVKVSAGAVFTLVMTLVALGGATAMFLAGRQHLSKALSPPTMASPDLAVPETRAPAPAPQAVSPSPAYSDDPKRDSDGDHMKRCPECAEWVKDAANVCRYCGSRFASTEPIGRP